MCVCFPTVLLTFTQELSPAVQPCLPCPADTQIHIHVCTHTYILYTPTYTSCAATFIQPEELRVKVLVFKVLPMLSVKELI